MKVGRKLVGLVSIVAALILLFCRLVMQPLGVDLFVVPINGGYATLLDNQTALTAYHLLPYNTAAQRGQLYADKDRDILVYTYQSDVIYTVNQLQRGAFEFGERFIVVPDLAVFPGDSGKPYFEKNQLVGVIVGSHNGHALVSTIEDLQEILTTIKRGD